MRNAIAAAAVLAVAAPAFGAERVRTAPAEEDAIA